MIGLCYIYALTTWKVSVTIEGLDADRFKQMQFTFIKIPF
jgi:hypothetical protein